MNKKGRRNWYLYNIRQEDMKNLRKEKGITLVALSITIVVSLILLGITINLFIGNNGVITKAKEIKSNIEIAEREGENTINSLKGESKYTEDGVVIANDPNAPTITNMEIINITDNSFKVKVNITETGSGLDKIEYSIDDGTQYITPNDKRNKEYTFTNLKVGLEEYKVKVKVTDEKGNSSYASKSIGAIKIGDYVNYTYDAVSAGYQLSAAVSGADNDQTISQPTTAIKWRILNINDDKSVDLISETPTDTTITFGGALGYNNGVYALNDICAKLYSNKSLGVTARSINLDDIEKQETPAGTKARKDYVLSYNELSPKYGSTHTYTTNLQYPLLYAKELGAGINTPTPTQPANLDIADPYKTSSIGYTNPPTTETSGTANANPGLIVTHTKYSSSINFTTEKYGSVAGLFEIINWNWYWVASRYASCHSDYACFGLCVPGLYENGLFYSDGFSITSSYRLRPVVSINSNIIDIVGAKDASGAWNLK